MYTIINHPCYECTGVWITIAKDGVMLFPLSVYFYPHQKEALESLIKLINSSENVVDKLKTFSTIKL